GMGCEGAMRVLLQPLSSANGYQPFATFATVLETLLPLTYATVVRSSDPRWPVGKTLFARDACPDDAGAAMIAECETPATRCVERRTASGDLSFFVDTIAPPPRLLLLGGGPDSIPVVEQAVRLGWSVTVIDHRPAYASAERFPRARVLMARPDE